METFCGACVHVYCVLDYVSFFLFGFWHHVNAHLINQIMKTWFFSHHKWAMPADPIKSWKRVILVHWMWHKSFLNSEPPLKMSMPNPSSPRIEQNMALNAFFLPNVYSGFTVEKQAPSSLRTHQRKHVTCGTLLSVWLCGSGWYRSARFKSLWIFFFFLIRVNISFKMQGSAWNS